MFPILLFRKDLWVFPRSNGASRPDSSSEDPDYCFSKGLPTLHAVNVRWIGYWMSGGKPFLTPARYLSGPGPL